MRCIGDNLNLKNNSNIYSVIDVGTNNVLLLISTSGTNPEIFLRRSATSALGKDMKDGMLTEAGILRAQKILAEFIALSKEFTQKIIIIGTSCSREAKNIGLLTDWLWQNYKINYQIISGEDEAILNGLANIEEFSEFDNLVLFDIGGGSTEFTYISNKRIINEITVPLGIRRFINEYGDNQKLICQKARELLVDIPHQLDQNIELIGIGGTACSLAAMKFGLKKYQSEIVHKSSLTSLELKNILEDIAKLSPEMLTAKLPFDTKRAEIIEVGALLIKEIVDSFQRSGFLVSDRGLQFGVLQLDKQKLAKML